MATKDLKELIKCSGNTAASGQSFRNHVAGAASGAKMSDYICSGWNWTGGPAGANTTPYATGQTFSMSANFLGGSRIAYIIRQGSGTISLRNVTINNGGSVTLNSSNTTNSATAAASVTIVSAYNTGVSPSGAGHGEYYYSGAAQGSTPPGSGQCSAVFIFTDSAGASDGGYDNVTFDLYMPNINAYTGNFNNSPSTTFTAAMTHRDVNPSEFTIQWCTDSGYTNVASGAVNYIVDEANMGASWQGLGPDSNGYTLYLRYIVPGGSSWNNYGAVTWYDTRAMY